jgi:hypothetical protein
MRETKNELICLIIVLAVVFAPAASFAKSKEHFFVSKHQPKYLLVNLGVMRIVIWRPWPFVSVSFGWMLKKSPKLKVLQMYFGIKCDGTRTEMIGGPPSCAMVLTPKELAAFRIHQIDRVPVWNNQGGA